MSLACAIEALLFAADQPLSSGRLAEILDGPPREEIETALHELRESYEGPARAFRLVAVAGGWQLVTKPEHSTLIRRLFTGKRRVRLTKAALETLAIIAYKQPTTRPEIDAIRGVASGGVLETLLERNLVRIAGRAEGIGRPLLYATTPDFLQYLGLNRLDDLPSLGELEAMLAERETAARLADDEEMAALAASAAETMPEPEVSVTAAAARLEARRREQNLPTLDELDGELRERTARLGEAAGRAAAERARHVAENAPASSPDPEGAEVAASAEASAPPAVAPSEAADDALLPPATGAPDPCD